MLRITSEAIRRLEVTLRETEEHPLDCLRIILTEDGPELIVDRQKTGDETLVREDRLLLVIDDQTMNCLYGRTLEVDKLTSLLVLA